MKYVNHEICSNDPNDTPNVSMIRVEGVRLVKNKIPRAVRNELMQGVKGGRLGRLMKSGLKPEAFFHPNSIWKAKEKRNDEERRALRAIAGVVCSASHLTEADQGKLIELV